MLPGREDDQETQDLGDEVPPGYWDSMAKYLAEQPVLSEAPGPDPEPPL